MDTTTPAVKIDKAMLENELREMLTQLGGSYSLIIKWMLESEYDEVSRAQGFSLKASILPAQDFRLEEKDPRFASYESNWKNACWKFPGLEKSWLGKTFMDHGKTYTIIGLTSNRRNKWPVMAVSKYGTWTRFSVNRIMVEMKKTP